MQRQLQEHMDTAIPIQSHGVTLKVAIPANDGQAVSRIMDWFHSLPLEEVTRFTE
jgi:hypothetical protein